MVPEYPKIDTLFERGEDFKVDPANLVIRRSEFGIPERWLVTEKVDGTNVRISLEQTVADLDGRATAKSMGLPDEWVDENLGEWRVAFYGRTAATQMPTFLLDHLQRAFTLERMKALWRGPGEAEYPIVLYGEGYGARIQKGGGNYRRDGDVSFRLFDVLVGETWLSRANVEDMARQLGIAAVPLLTHGDVLKRLGEMRFNPDGAPLEFLDLIVSGVKTGIVSRVSAEEGILETMAEGAVAFTDPPLFNGRGKRLMWKLKTSDFSR